jgi:hypothetical protein
MAATHLVVQAPSVVGGERTDIDQRQRRVIEPLA